jgi:ATP-dependent Clp protease ATP-binding subunit ClpC
MSPELNLHSKRAQKARLARLINKTFIRVLSALFWVITLSAATMFVIAQSGAGLILIGISMWLYMIMAWHKRELSNLPPEGNSIDGRLTADALGILNPGTALSPKELWKQLDGHWQSRFMTNRLLLHSDSVGQLLSSDEKDTAFVWQKASILAQNSTYIEAGHVVAALLLTSPQAIELSRRMKITENDIEDVMKWLERAIHAFRVEKPYFGGIGRDWASGFTPLLNRFGTNISQAIEHHGAHFGSLTESQGVVAIRNSLSQGAGGIALVGETGAGKTSHMYALAQVLLAEDKDPRLQHRQVVGLSASAIISAAQHPGQLEQIVTRLLNEAVRAGNIVLFMDDAEAFMRDGHGSFNATQLLLPAVQSRAVQIIMALSPHDYQRLKSENPNFAGSLMPVMLGEPDAGRLQQIVEDEALRLEHQHKCFITYGAVREAIILSGRYIQDMAYPGKAVSLLEQSLAYHDQGLVTASAVQQAIEQSRGVKLGDVSPVESDQLLNLEQQIHERMINQSRAVAVVSNALRRARAGVANKSRPIGSFLFLGPTGVGKTELAKAISATYFGSEQAMVRLDMSEYQQPDDVKRLLSDGKDDSSSLIMSVRQQPFSVVLLDEVEKAHTNILNLLLQLLDEGQLTDSQGKQVSFRDCVVIATSNAGANNIREHIEKGEQVEDFESSFTDELINSGQFKPELLNRFDEVVIFRPLNKEELLQVVALMVGDVNKTLAQQNIIVELAPDAAQKIVDAGYDPRLGARPMRRMVQRTIEDTVAKKILEGSVQPGDHIRLDSNDISVER